MEYRILLRKRTHLKRKTPDPNTGSIGRIDKSATTVSGRQQRASPLDWLMVYRLILARLAPNLKLEGWLGRTVTIFLDHVLGPAT